MSPQNSTLGLMGGVFKSTFNRAGQRSGIYRPEDNAYIRNYVDRIDNFFYTGNTITYPGTSNNPTALSSFIIRPGGNSAFEDNRAFNPQIISCSGFDTDGIINATLDGSALFSTVILKEASTGIETFHNTTKKPTMWRAGNIDWNPEPLGLSFSPDGTQLILCGNLVAGFSSDKGPIIYQYTLSTPWNITTIDGSSTWSYGGTNYGSVVINETFYFKPPLKIYYFVTPPASIAAASSIKVQDIFVAPNGLDIYYLRNNYIYQGTISSSWNIGVNGANLSFSSAPFLISADNVSSAALLGSFSGFTFNTTGTKLYVTSRLYGGTILQYNLGTAWNMSTASFETFLYLGNYEAGVGGSSFNPDGTGAATVTSPSTNFIGKRAVMLDDENMYYLTVNAVTCQLHKFKILPY